MLESFVKAVIFEYLRARSVKSYIPHMLFMLGISLFLYHIISTTLALPIILIILSIVILLLHYISSKKLAYLLNEYLKQLILGPFSELENFMRLVDDIVQGKKDALSDITNILISSRKKRIVLQIIIPWIVQLMLEIMIIMIVLDILALLMPSEHLANIPLLSVLVITLSFALMPFVKEETKEIETEKAVQGEEVLGMFLLKRYFYENIRHNIVKWLMKLLLVIAPCMPKLDVEVPTIKFSAYIFNGDGFRKFITDLANSYDVRIKVNNNEILDINKLYEKLPRGPSGLPKWIELHVKRTPVEMLRTLLGDQSVLKSISRTGNCIVIEVRDGHNREVLARLVLTFWKGCEYCRRIRRGWVETEIKPAVIMAAFITGLHDYVQIIEIRLRMYFRTATIENLLCSD